MTTRIQRSAAPENDAESVETDALTREASIRAHFDAGDMPNAASDTIGVYGPELMRFLAVRLRDREQADDAFSILCEEVWVGLPGFAWRSSLRTWLFVLAHRIAGRQLTVRRRDRERLTHHASALFDRTCAEVRTKTATYLRTETKHRVRALRDRLDEDQQTLLVLRVDQGLPWRELAIVMGEASMDAPAAELHRAAARVRTRFQAAKKRLRELAVEAGLIGRKS